jgi:hypothetical protein
MVDRAAGLAVVAVHPEKGVLDAAEYAGSAIGSIVLPYARDGELRGVAQLFISDETAAALASGEFSTSPGVSFKPGETAALPSSDGVLLIEGDPSLLDHVAICARGVWDKGGPVSGIRIDSRQETRMAENIEKTEKTEPDLAARMDEIMSSLGAVADAVKSISTRMDTLEETHAKRADMSFSGLDDPSVRDRKRDDSERAEKAEYQSRCDAVATAHGEQASPPMAGELPHDYRVRLLRRYQSFSPRFKEVDLRHIPAGPAFDGIEHVIYADAMAEADRPTALPGKLREIRRKLPGGGETVTFAGTWDDAFRPFRVTPRKYAGWDQSRVARV